MAEENPLCNRVKSDTRTIMQVADCLGDRSEERKQLSCSNPPPATFYPFKCFYCFPLFSGSSNTSQLELRHAHVSILVRRLATQLVDTCPTVINKTEPRGRTTHRTIDRLARRRAPDRPQRLLHHLNQWLEAHAHSSTQSPLAPSHPQSSSDNTLAYPIKDTDGRLHAGDGVASTLTTAELPPTSNSIHQAFTSLTISQSEAEKIVPHGTRLVERSALAPNTSGVSAKTPIVITGSSFPTDILLENPMSTDGEQVLSHRPENVSVLIFTIVGAS